MTNSPRSPPHGAIKLPTGALELPEPGGQVGGSACAIVKWIISGAPSQFDLLFGGAPMLPRFAFSEPPGCLQRNDPLQLAGQASAPSRRPGLDSFVGWKESCCSRSGRSGFADTSVHRPGPGRRSCSRAEKAYPDSAPDARISRPPHRLDGGEAGVPAAVGDADGDFGLRSGSLTGSQSFTSCAVVYPADYA